MTDKLTEVPWRSNCPVSCALDVVGDKWSLLILRDLLMKGELTFTQFLESPERISTNILTARLQKLRDCGFVYREPSKSNRNNAYRLTPVGQDFEAVIRALGVWSSKHLHAYQPDMVKLSGAG
jgi:DNA-binding HxlR family transcriptional regulator